MPAVESGVDWLLKLEGWLALYTLRLVLIPIIFLIDLVSSNTGTSDLSSDLKFYLLFASVGDVIFIVLSFFMWGAFFKKKIGALNLKYFVSSSHFSEHRPRTFPVPA